MPKNTAHNLAVWHEELSGMVEGPALYAGQQTWVRSEDVSQLITTPRPILSQDWKPISEAPRDGRPLLAYNDRYLDGLMVGHPMRYWTTTLMMGGWYWHPNMLTMNLGEDIRDKITEDMIPTHFIELTYPTK